MANLDQEVDQVKRPDKRSKTHHGVPRRPDMVRAIVEMYKHGMTWADIGREFGITRDGARKLYLRWHGWYLWENPPVKN